MRAKISVFEPLVRGFFLKSSVEDVEDTWFDFYYEKIPRGRLVHVEGRCKPPRTLLHHGCIYEPLEAVAHRTRRCLMGQQVATTISTAHALARAIMGGTA